MYLVIAEKPSVAKSIAKVLGAYKKGNGFLEGRYCIVTWCLGHLVQYASPEVYDGRYQKWDYGDLPILPEEWKLVISREKKEQFHTVKQLLNRPDLLYVVNACDAGREGELIFKWVYDLSGSRAPVKRLWISSLEDTAIKEGFRYLKPAGEYENLAKAAVCRAQADWLIGMNATRAFTTKYFKRLVVGRVQTPTLCMLVEREKEINGFKKQKYFNVVIDCAGLKAEKQKIFNEGEAERLLRSCDGGEAVVVSVTQTDKKEKPPKLYDLTTLQREANRYLGLTAQQTLNAAQSLYEKKLITYPRTDSRFLTDDMENTVASLLPFVREKYGYGLPVEGGRAPDIVKVMNNKKVSDHHAIIPTLEIGKVERQELKPEEEDVLHLVSLRLVEATGEEHVYMETLVEIGCGGEIFTAKGKTIRKMGWKQYSDLPEEQPASGADEMEDRVLPEVWKNQIFPSVRAGKTEHYTSPPKKFNEDTLLSAMETAGNKEFDAETEKKGLGTPATRAGIIEKLIRSKYAVRKGKQILPTEDGIALIGILPDFLKSASMTAEWENQLLLMEKGEMDDTVFLNGIRKMITMMLNGCDIIPEEDLCRFREKESIGVCPLCGKLVYAGRKNYYCSDRGCCFVLWKENRYFGKMKKSIDEKAAAELLKSGKTTMRNLYSSRKDQYFDADVRMKVEPDGKVTFSMEFPKNREDNRSDNTRRRKIYG